MVIDKFGRAREFDYKKFIKPRLLPQGYVLTANGDIDIQNRRITNLNKLPSEASDVASKHYVDELNKSALKELREAHYKLEVQFRKLRQAFNKLENKINGEKI